MQSLDFHTLTQSLPPVWHESLLDQIRQFRQAHPATFVVLDDDPTGNQCSDHLPILTAWDPTRLQKELDLGTPMVFVLTNSRSQTAAQVHQLYHQIGQDLTQLASISSRRIIPVTRGDSTLRGHYLTEIESLNQGLGTEPDMTLILPAFFEGGRYTYQGVHYYREADLLKPVGESPYAADPAFGYQHSYLPEWIREKSGGNIQTEEVAHIPLTEIRTQGPQSLAQTILISQKRIWTADAMTYQDMEVLSMALCQVEAAGKTYAIRTAASLLPSLIGKPPAKILGSTKVVAEEAASGGLVVVGSVVDKTTRQLNHLTLSVPHQAVEIPVQAVLADPTSWIPRLAEQVSHALQAGQLVILYTSRTWIQSPDEQANLLRNQALSTHLVHLIQQIVARPRFMIAKGGITASDLATRGLGIRRAWLEGPLLPGVPLWRADAQAKWPQIPYLVFPGNVGTDTSLTEAVNRLVAATNLLETK